MIERRRWPRLQVAWSVAMSIEGCLSICAQALDASLHGLRLAVDDVAALRAIRQGTRCQVEVHLSDGGGRFVRAGEVRHVGEGGVGLLISEPLPAALVPPGDPAPDVTNGAPSRRIPLMSMLRTVTLLQRKP